VGFEAAPIHGLPVVEGVKAWAPPATVFDVAVVFSGPPPLCVGVDSAGGSVDFVQEVLVRGVAWEGLDVEGDEVGVYAWSQPFGQGGDGCVHSTPPVLVEGRGVRLCGLGGVERAFRLHRGAFLISARWRAIPVRLVWRQCFERFWQFSRVTFHVLQDFDQLSACQTRLMRLVTFHQTTQTTQEIFRRWKLYRARFSNFKLFRIPPKLFRIPLKLFRIHPKCLGAKTFVR
jgi:hypothetical protein